MICLLPFFDKNSLWGKISIRQTPLSVNQERPQAMKEGFGPVFQITIAKSNLAAWSKSVSQRLQEVLYSFGNNLSINSLRKK